MPVEETQRYASMRPFVETENGHAEVPPLSGEVQSEIAALRSQMRILKGVAFGSLAVSMVVLAVLAHSYLGPSSTSLHAGRKADLPVLDLWEENDVIIPYGFKSCDSAAEPPQIAPVRKNGDFIFMSGILGYDIPCKSSVKDVHEQIEAAFRWANDTLTTAGITWTDVLSVTSYHVDLDSHQHIFSEMREKALPKPPYPAWTAVEVKKLYFPHEVFEMTIIARKQKCVGLECDER